MVGIPHFVRVGILGHVGRFEPVDGTRYGRGSRVICRTGRGLEVGEVLSAAQSYDSALDGDLVRGLTVEDELLLARLDKHRDEAFEACNRLLDSRGLEALLMDVEQTFDGGSLYFYFLGEVSPEVERLTSDLAATYEKEVKFSQFAETLTEGCGPDCGTEAAAGNGCSTGGCAGCAVAGACSTGGGG